MWAVTPKTGHWSGQFCLPEQAMVIQVSLSKVLQQVFVLQAVKAAFGADTHQTSCPCTTPPLPPPPKKKQTKKTSPTLWSSWCFVAWRSAGRRNKGTACPSWKRNYILKKKKEAAVKCIKAFFLHWIETLGWRLECLSAASIEKSLLNTRTKAKG